jgi:hypothetical protein
VGVGYRLNARDLIPCPVFPAAWFWTVATGSADLPIALHDSRKVAGESGIYWLRLCRPIGASAWASFARD